MKTVPFRSLATASVLLTLTLGASAQNLVTNGDFELTTNGPNKQLGNNTNATGWTTSGYNFLFAPGAADTTGAVGASGSLSLWGSNNGGAVTLPSSSPSGGNYVAADGAYEVGPLNQTINGLIIGNSYEVSFYWAAAQQQSFNGATTEQWKVSLGSQTHSTEIYHLPNHGFSGWMQETFTFTATATSSVLSFLAIGTPDGLPPFSLLDGVSMHAVPEPSAYLMAGVLACGAIFRRQRKNGAA
jgi:hypothetical protein